MNKLVSRNPVLRFKEGKLIKKFKNPSLPIYLMDNNRNKYKIGSDNKYYELSEDGTYYKARPGKTFEEINNTKKGQIAVSEKKGKIPLGGIASFKKNRERKPVIRTKMSSKVVSTPINYGLVGGIEKGWHGLKGIISNTDDLAMLKEMGYEGGAEGAQNFINKNLIKYGLGSSHVATDDMWGTLSLKGLKMAYDAWKNGQAAEQPTIPKNVSSPSILTPVVNFGYRTSNTYENNDFSDRLKTMGIRSNTDLTNFMHRTNGENYNWNGDDWARQFRSDVNQALGGDYSDANIRKVFNTKGNWGRGFLGRGDIGDFQNVLQTNAGTWNGSYDRNLGNYIKNIDWSKFKLFKQGGQLISKDPIKRFKLRNYCNI